MAIVERSGSSARRAPSKVAQAAGSLHKTKLRTYSGRTMRAQMIDSLDIPVLLLDEAQNYAMSALEEVRMLLGLNLPEQPAFALILAGDPYLLSTLRLRSHRALYSRIAAHARIEGLSRSEVEPYLEHQ